MRESARKTLFARIEEQVLREVKQALRLAEAEGLRYAREMEHKWRAK